jgi:hypothetical protein
MRPSQSYYVGSWEASLFDLNYPLGKERIVKRKLERRLPVELAQVV